MRYQTNRNWTLKFSVIFSSNQNESAERLNVNTFSRIFKAKSPSSAQNCNELNKRLDVTYC